MCLCVLGSVKEGYKERLRACMSESGHCSRKSDLNPGHPANIYATVVLKTVCCHQKDSSGLCGCKIFKLNRSVLLHVVRSSLYCQGFHKMNTNVHCKSSSMQPVTWLDYLKGTYKVKALCCMISQSMVIMLHHAAPIFAPDRQANMQSGAKSKLRLLRIMAAPIRSLLCLTSRFKYRHSLKS